MKKQQITDATIVAIKAYSTDKNKGNSLEALMSEYDASRLAGITEEQGQEFLKKLKNGERALGDQKKLSINLDEPNVVENFIALNKLRKTGMFTEEELQELHDKQVESDKRKEATLREIEAYSRDTEHQDVYNALKEHYGREKIIDVRENEALEFLNKLKNGEITL